jgi:PAS domain S-box-containing protein
MSGSQTLVQPTAVEVTQTSSKKNRVFTWLNSRLRGYIPALAVFAIALVVHSLATVLLGSAAPKNFLFFLYLLAFLTASWCGYGPGLLVTILITCLMPYLFKPNFSIRDADFGGIAIFLLLSIIVSGTASGRRRTEHLLRSMNNELDKRVGEQTKTLLQQLAELQTLYDKLSVGICFLDTDLRFVRVNEKLAFINGFSVDAHLGREFREMVNDAVANVVEPLCRRVIHTQEPILDHEFSDLPAGEGASRFWSVSCSPVATDGRILGLQAIVQDITERKEAEQALSQSNASLRRANNDLEQFAFSASHDLQEPLRTVAIYSQMLKKKFAGVLGPDGDEYIGYTVQGVTRMQQLVTDLLAYTHASLWDAEPVEPVSAKAALEQALSNLESTIAENQASITFSELPLVPMRNAHLVQLFQNLISNSIKYRKQEPLHVHVSALPHQGDTWLFKVSDNGIGIDPKYQQQVFEIFKRLHRHEEYPGTGLGLAICRRILEQHGGRIWVESKPGEGATFLFTLPAAQRADAAGS